MSGQGFRHEAAIYEGDDGFLAATVPFLREALAAGEPALVGVSGERTALLRGELGDDAAAVHFVEIEGPGRNPARLIPFWQDVIAARAGSPLRALGEPVWPGREPAEIDECQRHEFLLGAAFGDRVPALSLLCSYDAGALDDDILAAVGHSHPVVERDGVRSPSESFEPGRDCFAGDFSEPPRSAAVLEFDRTGLFDARQRVAWAAKSAGIPEGAAKDLVVAASELATNSIVHGGGEGTLRVWREGDRLLVEVRDRGRIEEPLAGRVRPEPTQVGGRGLWLANQFCDLVQIRSGAEGTAIRLQRAIPG
jgi:anti-sigma regulatory factor (Ser/Thr protein kinase)